MDELSSETSIDITFPTVELIIINDLGISFSPFLNLTLFECPISLKLSSNKEKLSILTETVLSLSSSYYNAQINKWEPILEKIAFLFTLAFDTKAKPNLVLDIENEVSFADLNLNFSTEMLKSVLKGVKYIKDAALYKEKQLFPIEENNEYLSPYMICNKTGYPLEILRNEIKPLSIHSKKPIPKPLSLPQQHLIENCSSISFQIENEQSFYQSSIHSRPQSLNITAQFTKEEALIYHPIPNINIQNIHIREHHVSGGKKGFLVVAEVVFDVETNKKVLTICSPLSFKNNSPRILEAKIGRGLLVINVGETVPVPFDMVKEQFQVRFHDTKEWSVPTSLSNFTEKITSSSKQLRLLDQFLSLRCENEGSSTLKRVLIFEPPFVIKNCLPITLTIQLREEPPSNTKKKKGFESPLVLEPQDSFELYEVPLEASLFCVISRIIYIFWGIL